VEGLKELVEYGVIGLLLGLSVWAIGVAVERYLFYRWVNVRQFATLDLCVLRASRQRNPCTIQDLAWVVSRQSIHEEVCRSACHVL
jgi:hypothetical protein